MSTKSQPEESPPEYSECAIAAPESKADAKARLLAEKAAEKERAKEEKAAKMEEEKQRKAEEKAAKLEEKAQAKAEAKAISGEAKALDKAEQAQAKADAKLLADEEKKKKAEEKAAMMEEKKQAMENDKRLKEEKAAESRLKSQQLIQERNEQRLAADAERAAIQHEATMKHQALRAQEQAERDRVAAIRKEEERVREEGYEKNRQEREARWALEAIEEEKQRKILEEKKRREEEEWERGRPQREEEARKKEEEFHKWGLDHPIDYQRILLERQQPIPIPLTSLAQRAQNVQPLIMINNKKQVEHIYGNIRCLRGTFDTGYHYKIRFVKHPSDADLTVQNNPDFRAGKGEWNLVHSGAVDWKLKIVEVDEDFTVYFISQSGDKIIM